MKAILLAAGYGSRLRPITLTLPKCLVPIAGKPLLGRWLDLLLNGKIESVLINTHYLADQVKAYIDTSPWKEKIVLVYEDKLLGTGGTIIKNQNFFFNESILICHADNLTKFDVNEFIRSHEKRQKGVEITMMTFVTDDPSSCGIVEEKDGLVIGFHEKKKNPPGNIANAAVYIFEPSVIDWMSKFKCDELDISNQVLPNYLGKIQSYLNENYHRDIGTYESLSMARVEYYD